MTLTMEIENSVFTATDFRRRASARAIPIEHVDKAHTASFFRGDHDLNPDLPTATAAHTTLRSAAVLVPVVDRGGETSVILTQRAAHLKSHGGQVAFPGGKMEKDETALHAAMRETMEEIGLAATHIEPIGLLDTYRSGTGFTIVPVLAMVSPGFSLTIDASEVADVFEVPLEFLMTPKNHRQHSVETHGRVRHFHAMPYGDRYIWGVTAGILRTMYERLYAK
jgi:8-oxo-dGTP pyrophosphatase MutT (NUDIX family)